MLLSYCLVVSCCLLFCTSVVGEKNPFELDYFETKLQKPGGPGARETLRFIIYCTRP